MKITLYSAPTCLYCHDAKKYLADLGDLEEVDVTGKPEVIEMLKTKTGKIGVPVIQIEDTYISGFDKVALIDAIAKYNGK